MNKLITSKKVIKISFMLIAAFLIMSLLSSCMFLDNQKISKTNTDPAFKIKLLSEDKTLTKLEPEEVAELIMPSTVVILSYSDTSSTYTGVGSGVIADADGYIITNAHVVDGSSRLEVLVGIGDFTTYTATLIGSDAFSDLAIIKIEPDSRVDLVPAKFGHSNDLKVASTVLAIGSPGGVELANSVTLGIVSALNREVTTSSGYTINCIQTDTPINPGNSGGPLVNMYGLVVGINSSKIAQVEYEGIGFSIAINDESNDILTSLKLNGKYSRPAIGITYKTFITTAEAAIKGYKYSDGTAISGVQINEITNPSLYSNGIRAGYIIIEIDDVKVTSTTVISSALKSKKVGDTISLKLYNPSTTGIIGNNRIITKEITLIERV